VQELKDKKFLKKLGNHIKKLRTAKGLTQLDLAIKLNNYAEQIGRIERGELNSSICTLKNIAERLDVSLAELLNVD
jgi:transcriptional regulator with XRE-family HTH domain